MSKLLRAAVAPLSLIALVLLFFRQAAFSNLIFAHGDVLLYFYPYWDYRAQSLLQGRLPLWNPYIFMGVPFLANSQAGIFYPLNLPLIFFSAPVAIKITLIAHIIIAAFGMYLLARRIFNLEPAPAIFSAAVFALSGYLTAQVEHVNQIQGLAWMPFALWATYQAVSSQPNRHRIFVIRHLSLLSLFIALQLTAGHTQTTFITLVGCGIVALWQVSNQIIYSTSPSKDVIRYLPFTIRHLSFFSLFIVVGFAVAAVQLLPTFELSQLSIRSGGLPFNEAVSFSLHPLLIGRSLLPAYNRVIFSEFVSYIGIIPLTLAIVGITEIRRKRLIVLAAVIAFIGLFFAFGGYNPIYWVLVRFIPGFNLFRVPARWLVLWTLGASLLAGFGLQSLQTQKIIFKKILLVASAPLLLIVITFLSANIKPAGETGVVGLPQWSDVVLWIAPLIIFFIVTRFQFSISRLLIIFSLTELLIASQVMPPNHLTTPDAYFSIRPAMTQLLATKNDTLPAGRFLSLSSLEFDPGDMRELKSAWDWQLPASEVYDAIVATKHKEMISPNLSMTWGMAAIDGYDGGVLPLRSYAEFIKQLGATGATTDGRLRQMLKTTPANAMLSLTNTQWLITDKSGDAWIDGVFYDLQFTEIITPEHPLKLDRLPNFNANALGLVFGDGMQEGEVSLTLSDGNTVTQKISGSKSARLKWERTVTIKSITITSPSSFILRGATLIDEKTESFHWLTLGAYRLLHSGDTKIYENMNVLPRVFISSCRDTTCSVFTNGIAKVTRYDPEHIAIQTQSDKDSYLILTDTFYPGWVATVDGKEVKIETAFGLFRSVSLSAGNHSVEFNFEPMSLKVGMAISVIGLIILTGLLIFSALPTLTGK